MLYGEFGGESSSGRPRFEDENTTGACTRKMSKKHLGLLGGGSACKTSPM